LKDISLYGSFKFPTSGNTGATVTDEEWITSDDSDALVGARQGESSYFVKFIQEPRKSQSPPNLVPLPEIYKAEKPDAGFTITKGGGKRSTFSEKQKHIIVLFYNRQKTSQIKANPSDVIEQMIAAGLTPLKESQIKSWWSTHHRKQKQLRNRPQE